MSGSVDVAELMEATRDILGGGVVFFLLGAFCLGC